MDVNEQNQQAVDFYLKTGFVQTGRRATDDFGKAYPILEMILDTKNKNPATENLVNEIASYGKKTIRVLKVANNQ